MAFEKVEEVFKKIDEAYDMLKLKKDSVIVTLGRLNVNITFYKDESKSKEERSSLVPTIPTIVASMDMSYDVLEKILKDEELAVKFFSVFTAFMLANMIEKIGIDELNSLVCLLIGKQQRKLLNG